MVMPSPFERMMQQAAKLAESEPHQAWDRLDELYGKSLTDIDARNLAAFAAHLGGAGLGRWDDTIAFLRRCLEHDGLEEGGDAQRSIWRALAVIYDCAGKEAEATDAIAAGVRNEAEHCRVYVLAAQTLAARRRLDEAEARLAKALPMLGSIDSDDEVLQQAAVIANNLTRLAEQRLVKAQGLLVTASATTLQAVERLDDAANLHKALYQRGRALAQASKPAEALNIVQRMMALEDQIAAGPVERFHSAALACLCQIIRGQFKIAEQALGACQQFAAQVDGDTQQGLITVGKDLKQRLGEAKAAVAGE